MFLELIATFIAGFAGAGVMLLLGRLTGGRLPRWLVPLAAGLAMIAFTIFNEYSWFSRTQGNLPDGMVVAQTVENRQFYRPWTYAVPFVTRFVAVDRASMRTNPAFPGERMVDLYFFGRWAPVRSIPVAFDCMGGRRADLFTGDALGPDGTVNPALWRVLPGDDPVLQTACAED